MPHVSVAIPSYNHGAFVGRAIQSVLDQSHPDLDVLVVDDASSDDSFEIAGGFEHDPRVRRLRNASNLGLAGNWNRCLELARGPLVLVLASDDSLDPGYLAHVSRVFTERPDLGLVYAPVRIVDARDAVLEPGTPREPRLLRAGDDAVSALIRGGIGTVTTVFRRACCEELGGYDPCVRDGPDIELCARIARRFDIYDLGEIGGSFRTHDRKWTYLSYLKPERLEQYMTGNRRVWDHLSEQGRRALGVPDLDRFIARDGATFALNGALVAIAYRRPALAREYLRRARQLDPVWPLRRHTWQALLLLALRGTGARIMRRRMHLPASDAAPADAAGAKRT